MTKPAINPALEAIQAKARELAAAAPVQALKSGQAKKVKPPKQPRVQFLVRLTEPAREAIRDAAWREKLSEQEFIERFALSLTQPE